MGKKIIAILILNIYAVSFFGIAVKQFYCCGKLRSTSISFVEETKKPAKPCDSEDCCKTKYKTFKVKDSHFAANAVNSTAKLYFTPSTFIAITEAPGLKNSPKSPADISHAPPLNGTPVYIFNCVYRI